MFYVYVVFYVLCFYGVILGSIIFLYSVRTGAIGLSQFVVVAVAVAVVIVRTFLFPLPIR